MLARAIHQSSGRWRPPFSITRGFHVNPRPPPFFLHRATKPTRPPAILAQLDRRVAPPPWRSSPRAPHYEEGRRGAMRRKRPLKPLADADDTPHLRARPRSKVAPPTSRTLLPPPMPSPASSAGCGDKRGRWGPSPRRRAPPPRASRWHPPFNNSSFSRPLLRMFGTLQKPVVMLP